MNTTARTTGALRPFFPRQVSALRKHLHPFICHLHALLRQLDRLHAACACQRRDGTLLCGLAGTGYIRLS